MLMSPLFKEETSITIDYIIEILFVGNMMQCVVLDGNLLDEVVLDGN